MKKTAVLLFDLFSNYEIGVALSVLAQADREYDVFSLNEEVVSEEGLHVRRTKAFSELDRSAYDSLLMPGCMDLRDIIDDGRIHDFLRNFDLSQHIIAAISSSPILLLKAGMMEGKSYLAGVVKEDLLEESFTMGQMEGMRDFSELKNDDGTVSLCFADGNLLTAVGPGFVQFGIDFGNMLGLAFDPAWYQ